MEVNKCEYMALQKAYKLACETLEECAANDESWQDYLWKKAKKEVNAELTIMREFIPIDYIEAYQDKKLHHISDYHAWEVLHHLIRDWKKENEIE